MITDEDVGRVLRESWGLPDNARIERHDGGMGSRTWIVDDDGLEDARRALLNADG